MPTEIFTRKEFEAALPVIMKPVSILSEYTYAITVKPDVEILITSSIPRGSDVCDGTGKNSIRAWLVDGVTRKPLGSKTQRWVARTSGWRDNLLNNLRQLWRIGKLLGSCPQCRTGTVKVFKAGKGENKGSMFIKCMTGESFAPGCGYFKWLPKEMYDTTSKSKSQTASNNQS